MNKSFIILILTGIITVSGNAQVKKRALPANINQPSLNTWAPAISGDGNTLIFLSDYSRDGHHSMYFAEKKGSQWNDPTEIDRGVNNPNLNYRGGYSLSFDGKEMYFTSRKSGLGGFEIWMSKRQGSNWSAPSNLGKPVNSSANEGTPSLSPDGQELYFMRCDKMSEYGGASGCKIYVTSRKYGRWQEPEPLPNNINTGDVQNPKILADGSTLIFSSNRDGGQGKLDLYMSRRTGSNWDDPIPMNFINSDKDDQFVSVAAKGRYLYMSEDNGKDEDLVQVLIPDEFKPANVMRLQGKVVDSEGQPISARLTVFNVDLRNRIWNENLDKSGEFTMVLKEGSTYDIALTPTDAGFKYYSKIYDLTEIGRRDRETLDITLKKATDNDEFETPILFEPYGYKIDDRSTFELRRLNDMLRKNEDLAIEINISQTNYQEDTLKAHPDLTETRYDSILIKKKIRVTDTTVTDKIPSKSISTVANDSTYSSYSRYEPETNDESIEQWQIHTVYHNDRTDKQGQELKNYFLEKGISPNRIQINTHRIVRPSTDRPEDHRDFRDIYVMFKILSI